MKSRSIAQQFFSPRRSHRTYNPLSDTDSAEFSFRKNRFINVRNIIQEVLREKETCSILDIGGTEIYWKIGKDFISENTNRIRIHLLNIENKTAEDRNVFQCICGDATDNNLLGERRFDIVHSNSVIEHVGRENMSAYADNVRRLAPRYFVQTPNYWFPFEPHFRLPAFQYLPEFARISIIQNFAVGFFDRVPDYDEAKNIIRHHDMIAARQMRVFFPDAEISFERFFGMNKSIMAVRS